MGVTHGHGETLVGKPIKPEVRLWPVSKENPSQHEFEFSHPICKSRLDGFHRMENGKASRGSIYRKLGKIGQIAFKGLRHPDIIYVDISPYHILLITKDTCDWGDGLGEYVLRTYSRAFKEGGEGVYGNLCVYSCEFRFIREI